MSEAFEPRENKNLRVAEAFCDQFPGLVYCEEDDIFYHYTAGYYAPLSRQQIHSFLLDKCTAMRFMSDSNQKHTINQVARIKRRALAEYNTGEYINLPNGLYDINTHKLKPHNDKYLSTIRIPYEYNPDAKCFLWLKTLEEIFEGDQNPVRTLKEFFGYCFTKETDMEKAMVLIGMGGTGKSTIATVLRELIGLPNCSSLSLRDFSNRTMIGVIKNKLANIIEEVPKKIEDYETEFCNIVSGGLISANPKWVLPYDFKPYCKLFFACNRFPHIDDETNAFYRRLLLIRMDRIFKEEEQDKNLKKNLLNELPGIFNWSMEGLYDLKKRGCFHIDEYMKKEIEHLQESNNPIRTWIKENVMVSYGAELVKAEAYEHYKQWCVKFGHRPFGITKFSPEVYMCFRGQTKKDAREGIGDRRHCWPNLTFRTPENEMFGKKGIEWQE